jgi:hypothetical protein
MNAADQIALFEPKGDDLAVMAPAHLALANRKLKASENLSIQGLTASASAYMRAYWEQLEQAAVLESACQFERLGGLS